MKKGKKHTGFGTPDDYFDQFEDRLFTKMSEGHIPKETGFKTPEGYFDELDVRLLKEIEQSKDSTKIIPLFTRRTLLYAASIAACAIIIFSLMNNSETITHIDDIEISSIETFIDEGMLGYDINDVTALLDEEDIFNSIDDQLNNELLEEYILKNIDYTTLLTE
jgi:hypothetical protein